VELLSGFLDLVLHLDTHLQALTAQYGAWIYAILFAVIFCETGLVVTPFLPGDSLLFVAGALSATGNPYVHDLFLALAAASFLGDNANYWIGRYLGPRLFRHENSRVLNPAHLARTQRFYDRYGAKTVFMARFVPIVRTFAPFVAGMGSMRYPRFLFYSFSGSIAWTGSLIYAGYTFGNMPAVRENLSLVIVGIVVISVLPGVIEFVRQRRSGKA
jgi:membrane-associated protein